MATPPAPSQVQKGKKDTDIQDCCGMEEVLIHPEGREPCHKWPINYAGGFSVPPGHTPTLAS